MSSSKSSSESGGSSWASTALIAGIGLSVSGLVYAIHTLFKDDEEAPKVTRKKCKNVLAKILKTHKEVQAKLMKQRNELRGHVPEETLVKILEEQRRHEFAAEEAALFEQEKVDPVKLREACDSYKNDDAEVKYYVDELEKLVPRCMPLKEFLVIMETVLKATHDTMESVLSQVDHANEDPDDVNRKMQMALTISRAHLLRDNKLTEEALQSCMSMYIREKEMEQLLTIWNVKMEGLLSKYKLTRNI